MQKSGSVITVENIMHPCGSDVAKEEKIINMI